LGIHFAKSKNYYTLIGSSLHLTNIAHNWFIAFTWKYNIHTNCKCRHSL